VSKLKQTIKDINALPIGNRVIGYSMLLIGLLMFLFGVSFALFVVWALLNGESNGTFPPHFDPDTFEWGIR